MWGFENGLEENMVVRKLNFEGLSKFLVEVGVKNILGWRNNVSSYDCEFYMYVVKSLIVLCSWDNECLKNVGL